MDYFEKLNELIRHLIRILDEEYAVISELLHNMDSLPNTDGIQRDYYSRLEQLEHLRKVSYQFLRALEDRASIYSCASSGDFSSFISEVYENGEERLKERESFLAALDSLDMIDDDAKEMIEEARKQSQDIAASTAGDSMDVPLSDQEQAALCRKQLADVLRKGEPITISQSGNIESSMADAIAALREQLAGGSELMINADGTVLNSDDPLESSTSGERFKLFDMAVVAGGKASEWDCIQVPEGKLAGGYGMCRICGTVFNQTTHYCPECGTKVVIEKPAITLDKVQFSVVAPKTFVKGNYSLIEIMMYEDAFRYVVQDAIANADDPVKETKSGVLKAEREANITIVLSSPDIDIEDNNETQIWQGEYLSFSFVVKVPEKYKKKQILFVASVYINDIIATRLKFVAKCRSLIEQKIEVTREDILSAFVSYASQDRNRVAMIIQGMKKARPDMDIFFDVDSLRSGDDWEKALWREIDKRDILFLCWSKYARESKWVDAEWRYALKQKGAESIEPVPIDPPGSCPPPDELSHKHFNDKLLYIINSNVNSSSTDDEIAW